MTNKTEIAELRDKLNKALAGTGWLPIAEVANEAISKLEEAEARIAELEGERNRALKAGSAARKEFDVQYDRAEKAEAEIAALRGAAVPLGYIHRGMWEQFQQAVCTGGENGFNMYSEAENHFPVFTTPQPAPVVVLPSKYNLTIDSRDEPAIESYGDGTGTLFIVSDVIAMLENAGITVKAADGEV